MHEQHLTKGDAAFAVMVWICAGGVFLSVLWLLGDIIFGGIGHLSLGFISELPEKSGRAGGILSILVSTAIIVSIALAVAIPIGSGAAIWLNEFGRTRNRFARIIHLSLDVLAGTPSIVFGLFGNALFCKYFGLGFSMLSGGLTLACMILPIYIRTVQSGLENVPEEWRLGAAALGLSKLATLWQLSLPAAAPAITAGLILGMGRAMAETAALVFTSGYVDRMPESIMDSGRSLAVHIYDLSMNVTGGDQAAYTSALVLIIMLLIIHIAAEFISDRLLTRRIVAK